MADAAEHSELDGVEVTAVASDARAALSTPIRALRAAGVPFPEETGQHMRAVIRDDHAASLRKKALRVQQSLMESGMTVLGILYSTENGRSIATIDMCLPQVVADDIKNKSVAILQGCSRRNLQSRQYQKMKRIVLASIRLQSCFRRLMCWHNEFLPMWHKHMSSNREQYLLERNLRHIAAANLQAHCRAILTKLGKIHAPSAQLTLDLGEDEQLLIGETYAPGSTFRHLDSRQTGRGALSIKRGKPPQIGMNGASTFERTASKFPTETPLHRKRLQFNGSSGIYVDPYDVLENLEIPTPIKTTHQNNIQHPVPPSTKTPRKGLVAQSPRTATARSRIKQSPRTGRTHEMPTSHSFTPGSLRPLKEDEYGARQTSTGPKHHAAASHSVDDMHALASTLLAEEESINDDLLTYDSMQFASKVSSSLIEGMQWRGKVFSDKRKIENRLRYLHKQKEQALKQANQLQEFAQKTDIKRQNHSQKLAKFEQIRKENEEARERFRVANFARGLHHVVLVEQKRKANHERAIGGAKQAAEERKQLLERLKQDKARRKAAMQEKAFQIRMWKQEAAMKQVERHADKRAKASEDYVARKSKSDQEREKAFNELVVMTAEEEALVNELKTVCKFRDDVLASVMQHVQ